MGSYFRRIGMKSLLNNNGNYKAHVRTYVEGSRKLSQFPLQKLLVICHDL